MKKLTALTLVIALLLGVIASLTACGGGDGGDTAVTTAAADAGAVTEETELLRENTPDTLPAGLNYNGMDVRIHVRGDTGSIEEFEIEQTGDVIDDAIYRRNSSVEERLNVELSVVIGHGWEKYNDEINKIRNSILSADNAFDIVSGWSARIPVLAVEGCFMNMYDLPHIDFDQPWWVQSLIEELTIADNLYFLTGDITLTILRAAYAIVFNKSMAEKYQVGDLYQTVLDDKWTIDDMSEVVKGISSDLNGDGVMDEKDQYGSVWTAMNDVDSFLQSSGIKMITKDSDGYPVWDFEYDKIAVLVEKVYGLMFENDGVLGYNTAGGTAGENQSIMFIEDRVLLRPAVLSYCEGSLKEMESDYGIIPYPKYDEKQEEYLTRIQDAAALMCVPISQPTDKLDAVGAVLEAMAAESYRNVTASFFEVAMKVKYSRDEVSSQMLDIIRGGAYLNFASIYNESIGYPWFVMRNLMCAKSKDFASWFAKNEPTIIQKLEVAVNSFKSNE